MKRTTPGYAAYFRVAVLLPHPDGQRGVWRDSRPCLMGWAHELQRRLQRRGHRTIIERA